MVLTVFPATFTGNVCRVCAFARCTRPQPQKTSPAAAVAPPRKKSRRVVMKMPPMFFFVSVTYDKGRVVIKMTRDVRDAQRLLDHGELLRMLNNPPVASGPAPPATTAARQAHARSDRLDAGLCDDVAPFRHFVGDALFHAVGTVGDHLEAVIAQLLGDLGRPQDGER